MRKENKRELVTKDELEYALKEFRISVDDTVAREVYAVHEQII